MLAPAGQSIVSKPQAHVLKYSTASIDIIKVRKSTVGSQAITGAWVPANARELACLSALTAAQAISADRCMTHALWA